MSAPITNVTVPAGRPVAEPIRLSELASGCTARLHAALLRPEDCALLKALGLTDRSVMRVCQVGEPCIVQVKTTRIGLSRVVADGILVVPEPVS